MPRIERNSSHGSGRTMSRPLLPMMMPDDSSADDDRNPQKADAAHNDGDENAAVATMTSAAKERLSVHPTTPLAD